MKKIYLLEVFIMARGKESSKKLDNSILSGSNKIVNRFSSIEKMKNIEGTINQKDEVLINSNGIGKINNEIVIDYKTIFKKYSCLGNTIDMINNEISKDKTINELNIKINNLYKEADKITKVFLDKIHEIVTSDLVKQLPGYNTHDICIIANKMEDKFEFGNI